VGSRLATRPDPVHDRRRSVDPSISPVPGNRQTPQGGTP
jgi:hypothetical protein